MALCAIQSRLEKHVQADGDTRKLAGLSTKKIPDVPVEALRRNLHELPDQLREGMKIPCYTDHQRTAMAFRCPATMQGDSQKAHSFFPKYILLQDKGHDRYSELKSRGCLFNVGFVSAVHVQPSLNGDGVLCAYDGNDDAVVNMGAVGTSGVYMLFSWELIRLFWETLRREETNFTRFVYSHLELWCNSIRGHDDLRILMPGIASLDRREDPFQRRTTTGGMLYGTKLTAGIGTKESTARKDLGHAVDVLVSVFTNACLDYKNLLEVDWSSVFRCECEFASPGPGQIIYDNGCNLVHWVGTLTEFTSAPVLNIPLNRHCIPVQWFCKLLLTEKCVRTGDQP